MGMADEAHAAAFVVALGFGAGENRQAINVAARGRRLLNIGLAFGAYQSASLASSLVALFIGPTTPPGGG